MQNELETIRIFPLHAFQGTESGAKIIACATSLLQEPTYTKPREIDLKTIISSGALGVSKNRSQFVPDLKDDLNVRVKRM